MIIMTIIITILIIITTITMIIMILITKAFPQRLVPAAGFSASSCQRASTSLDMPSKPYDMDMDMTSNQINDTFLFQNRVKVKVVGEVSEK